MSNPVIRRLIVCALALAAFLAAIALVADRASTGPPYRKLPPGLFTPAVDLALAPTPPMGYNDWNAFHCHVNERLIEETAAAMVSSGMKAAGYRYVNIDDCWAARTRDAQGSLRADPRYFPHGMRSVAIYVHSLGLKLGIYSSAGGKTCEGYPGSLHRERQDARTFAAWGIDYLKYDWCGVPYDAFPGYTHEQVAKILYSRMSRALRSSGRPIVFSMSNAGDPTIRLAAWSKTVGNLWRTAGDIADSWESVLANLDANIRSAPQAGPGHWNDPDMLEVGNGHMTGAEDRAQFSLWSIMAAPLFAGTDIRVMSAGTRAILTNGDVVAVDQDPDGHQGIPVLRSGNAEVLVKTLANGDRALVLLNRGTPWRVIVVDTRRLGLSSTRHYVLRNLWTHAVRTSVGKLSVLVPPRSVAMFRISVGMSYR